MSGSTNELMLELCNGCRNIPAEREDDYRLLHRWQGSEARIVVITQRPSKNFAWNSYYSGAAKIVRELTGCKSFGYGTPDKNCELDVYWTHFFKCKQKARVRQCPDLILKQELTYFSKNNPVVVAFSMAARDWIEKYFITVPGITNLYLTRDVKDLEQYLDNAVVECTSRPEFSDDPIRFHCIPLPNPVSNNPAAQVLFAPPRRKKNLGLIRNKLVQTLKELKR